MILLRNLLRIVQNSNEEKYESSSDMKHNETVAEAEKITLAS